MKKPLIRGAEEYSEENPEVQDIWGEKNEQIYREGKPGKLEKKYSDHSKGKELVE